MTSMKRSREVEEEAMANCALMLLSRLNNTSTENGFECKTCNKRFPSFQALGGHRASHKRPRLLGEFLQEAKKKTTHECHICGMEFSLGQALGGHMRRHQKKPEKMMTIPVLNRSNSSKRIFCFDLNLTPDENVDFKLWSAPVSSPVLRCFI